MIYQGSPQAIGIILRGPELDVNSSYAQSRKRRKTLLHHPRGRTLGKKKAAP
jgi:hypothetical protein